MIKQFIQPNNLNTKFGLTMEKLQLWQKISKNSVKCNMAVFIHAVKTQNEALKQKAYSIHTEMFHLKKEERIRHIQSILDEATTHVNDAGKWGYTEDDLAELKNHLEQFSQLCQNHQASMENKNKVEDLMPKLVMKRNHAA